MGRAAELGFARLSLSCIAGDWATAVSPLVLWNSCRTSMSAALGVSSLGYAGRCFFNLLDPLMTIIFTVIGVRALKSNAPGPRHSQA